MKTSEDFTNPSKHIHQKTTTRSPPKIPTPLVPAPEIAVQQRSLTPQFSMSKTRNRYRLRKHKPTACDEMLFGNSSGPLPEKEWKAPWDTSKSKQPLVFDSTDRTGFYSTYRPRPSDIHEKIKTTQKPWK